MTAPHLEWRHVGRDELDHERLWSGVFLLGFGLAVAVPEALRLKLACPFKELSGLPCLTCGSNRALSALLRLDFGQALLCNPLVSSVVFLWALYATYALVVTIARLPRLRLIGSVSGARPLAIALAGMAIAANWLYLYLAGI